MRFKLFALFLSIGLVFFSCEETNQNTKNDIVEYSSSAEFVTDNFLTDSLSKSKFRGVEARTDKFSRTGKYAIKLDSLNPYGFSMNIDNPKEGELFQVSVWQKVGVADGTLMCSIKGHSTRTIRTFVNKMPIKDGWIHHKLNLIVGKNVDELVFYCFSGGATCYFDDIKITRFPKVPIVESENKLNIFIPELSQKLLDSYIDDALKGEIISKAHKQYVDAFIIDKVDSIPIKMRLKGDWTDHLTLGKISYRIKIKGDHSYMGLKTFSIQHPKTRNNMHEWFMHKICDKEDILSTKYEFLPVYINGVNKGVYAIEEHFDKQLLESRRRREGPILKFDEGGFWAIKYKANELNLDGSFPYYPSSYVSFFKKKRTLKNKVLKSQFIEGSKLLTLFKNNTKEPEAIFNIEHLAKYYAILGIGNANHALNWHNRRFYFNSITQKLEHIGFDMLAGERRREDLTVVKNLTAKNLNREFYLDIYVMKNSEFRKYYKKYLKEYTDKNYLDGLFSTLDSEIKENEILMNAEMNLYQFDKSFYYDRAEFIQDQLLSIDSIWDAYLENDFDETKIRTSNYKPNSNTFYIKEISINSYLKKIDSSNFVLQLENYHLNDVQLIGYITKRYSDSIIYFEKSKTLKAFGSNKLSTLDIPLNLKPKKIVFKIANNPDSVYTKAVFKWPKPKGESVRTTLKTKFKTKSKWYSIKDNRLTFNVGNLQIDELVYIPKKYKVIIKEGTRIDMLKGGGLIINNSISMLGSSNNPIDIYSSDTLNHGVTILDADSVIINFVNFKNLNALHYLNWNLTGAVTIYESDVHLSNCHITSNVCEDALNIIRSEFKVDNISIENTFSDGFDADFCSGELTNSLFKNTGNDCIDFSGSNVNISYINIFNSGDKGISGGEKSILKLKDISINGAITGVASKDGTKITGHSIKINHAEYGFASFKKKPEYDSATIDVENVEMTSISTKKVLVDLGSIVIIDSKKYLGQVKLDVDALYERFEKK